jgi:hypothetical protein
MEKRKKQMTNANAITNVLALHFTIRIQKMCLYLWTILKGMIAAQEYHTDWHNVTKKHIFLNLPYSINIL